MANVCEHCGAEHLDTDVKCSQCGRPLMSTGVHRMIGSVVLDQYEVTGVLGQGGMSVVYQARHRLTDQQVALKILPRELAAHPQVKSRFLEEARALAQLDHPNIVHLYTFGENDGCLVLAMQYVRGKTWEQLIVEQDRMAWRDATRIAIDVLKALEYAHGQGVVHRDMKPSNVLVREDNGAATVMDFGIAKMATSTRLTATGQTMGTVRYMSPEQVRGKPVDATTDIYSLGVTLYEAIVGDTPFDGETHFEIMTKHLNEPPPPPSQHGVDLPDALEGVILTALAKRKEDRFPTAFVFRKALEAVLEGRPVTRDAAPPGGPPAVERGRAVAPARGPAAVTAPFAPGTPVSGIASTLEPAVAAGDAALRRGTGWLWLAVAIVVAAGGAAAYWLSRAPGAAPAAADATAAADAAPAGPPAPYRVPGLVFAVDQPYEADRMRVLSVRRRDPEPIAEAVRVARERFLSFLRERGADAGVAPGFVNVVVVPSHVICDRRLYESDAAFDGCEKRASHYRAHERTLYVAEGDRMLDLHLPSEIALQMCLDAGEGAPCVDELPAYERYLYAGARDEKPKKKGRR